MQYTPAEVAALLQVTVYTVRRRIKEGKLPAQVYGPRTVRVSDADLKAYMLRTRTIPPDDVAQHPATPTAGR